KADRRSSAADNIAMERELTNHHLNASRSGSTLCIEFSLRLLDVVEVVDRPVVDRREGSLQRATQVGDRILNGNWRLRYHAARNQPVALEPPQGLGERLMGDPFQSAHQCVETCRPLG